MEMGNGNDQVKLGTKLKRMLIRLFAIKIKNAFMVAPFVTVDAAKTNTTVSFKYFSKL